MGDWSIITVVEMRSAPSIFRQARRGAAANSPSASSTGVFEFRVARLVQRFERAVKHVVHQGRFARAGYAGDRHHHAERNLHVDVLKVVERARRGCAARAVGSTGRRSRGGATRSSPRR